MNPTESIRIDFTRGDDTSASLTQHVTIATGGLGDLYVEIVAAIRKYQSEHGLTGVDNNTEVPGA